MADRRGVIYLSVGWSSLPTLLRRSAFRRESWYVRTRVESRAGERLLNAFRARQIDLDSVPLLPTGADSTEGPARRGIAALDRKDLRPLTDWYAERYPDVPGASDILHNALVRAVTARTVDAFYAQLWARAREFESTVFVGATSWDQLLLQDRNLGYRVVGRASRALSTVADVGRQLRRILGSGTGSSSARADLAALPVTEGEPRDWSAASAATGSVLFVLNISTVFGGLYSYEHVFTDDPDSPLGPGNVVAMAINGGPHNPQGVRQSYPSAGSRRRRLTGSALLTVKALRHFGARYPLRYVALLSAACAQADGQRASLLERFPAGRIAILSYDLQIPIELILSLEAAGIRTVALNERPLSVAVVSQPIAVSKLLTAGPFFSEAAVESPSIAVCQAPAVGMWRTDLIREYGRSHDDAWNSVRVDGRRRVLALPYHVDRGPRLASNPLATAADSVRHFLTDILDLAEERSDIYIVIRGKNDHWLDDPRFADIANRVAASDAVEVSRRYDRLNESYRLVAHADLVVGKHSSLVDEALACDIPSVLHDYTPNSRDVARPIVRYLPRDLWALDRDEFRRRIAAALADDGAGFSDYWTPLRAEIFGELADGQVRDRARRAMVELLRGT